MTDFAPDQSRRTFEGSRPNPVEALAWAAASSLHAGVLYVAVAVLGAWLLSMAVPLPATYVYDLAWSCWAYLLVRYVARSWRERRDRMFVKDVHARYAAIAGHVARFPLATSAMRDGVLVVVETTAPIRDADGSIVLKGTYRKVASAARAKRHPCGSVTVDRFGRIHVTVETRDGTYRLSGASLFDPEASRTLKVESVQAPDAPEWASEWASDDAPHESGPETMQASGFTRRPRRTNAPVTLRVKPPSTSLEREADAMIAERAGNTDADLARARRRVALRFHPDRAPVARRDETSRAMAWANARIDDIEDGQSE